MNTRPNNFSNPTTFRWLITSGFGESGPAGRQLETELLAAAREAGLLILVPNTMGIVNPHASLYCTGTRVTPWPAPPPWSPNRATRADVHSIETKGIL